MEWYKWKFWRIAFSWNQGGTCTDSQGKWICLYKNIYWLHYGTSWVGWLNILLFQFLFFRLAYQKKDFKKINFSILFPIVPLTGWKNPYIPQKYFNIRLYKKVTGWTLRKKYLRKDLKPKSMSMHYTKPLDITWIEWGGFYSFPGEVKLPYESQVKIYHEIKELVKKEISIREEHQWPKQ